MNRSQEQQDRIDELEHIVSRNMTMLAIMQASRKHKPRRAKAKKKAKSKKRKEPR